MTRVAPTPALAKPTNRLLSELYRTLILVLQRHAAAINALYDGDQPVRLPVYTVATVPDAQAGALIHVSDETGGSVTAFYDGSDWRRVTDRAVVS